MTTKTLEQINNKLQEFQRLWNKYPSSQYTRNKHKIHLLKGIVSELTRDSSQIQDLEALAKKFKKQPIDKHNVDELDWAMREIGEWLLGEEEDLLYSLDTTSSEIEQDFYFSDFENYYLDNLEYQERKQLARKKFRKKFLANLDKEQREEINSEIKTRREQGDFFNKDYVPRFYRPSWTLKGSTDKFFEKAKGMDCNSLEFKRFLKEWKADLTNYIKPQYIKRVQYIKDNWKERESQCKPFDCWERCQLLKAMLKEAEDII